MEGFDFNNLNLDSLMAEANAIQEDFGKLVSDLRDSGDVVSTNRLESLLARMASMNPLAAATETPDAKAEQDS